MAEHSILRMRRTREMERPILAEAIPPIKTKQLYTQPENQQAPKKAKHQKKYIKNLVFKKNKKISNTHIKQVLNPSARDVTEDKPP